MKLPVWFAYAIERLPLISSFYEIQYGLDETGLSGAAFIQLRRNHDKPTATRTEIATAILGALLHDILNPLRLVDATFRTALNLANLALAPLYAFRNLVVKTLLRKVGFITSLVVSFPLLTLPLWIANTALTWIGRGFQFLLGRQRAGLSYQSLQENLGTLEGWLEEAKTAQPQNDPSVPSTKTTTTQGGCILELETASESEKMLEALRGHRFFNAEAGFSNKLSMHNLLGLKPGRLEHLQNRKITPLGPKSDSNDKDLPARPSLVYSLADIPARIILAPAHYVEKARAAKGYAAI